MGEVRYSVVGYLRRDNRTLFVVRIGRENWLMDTNDGKTPCEFVGTVHGRQAYIRTGASPRYVGDVNYHSPREVIVKRNLLEDLLRDLNERGATSS